MDESKLTWDNDKKSWSGLAEQLETIKKEQAYLFNEAEGGHQDVSPKDSASNVSAETLALRNL